MKIRRTILAFTIGMTLFALLATANTTVAQDVSVTETNPTEVIVGQPVLTQTVYYGPAIQPPPVLLPTGTTRVVTYSVPETYTYCPTTVYSYRPVTGYRYRPVFNRYTPVYGPRVTTNFGYWR